MNKRVLVVIRAAERARVAEALRAALGLGLRGDAVEVWLMPAAEPVLESDDAAIARARRTLHLLGVPVLLARSRDFAERTRTAGAVEVWT